MKCRLCGGLVDEKDDAIDVLLRAGKTREALKIFGSGYHLEAHPEYNCPGHPEARQIAHQSAITEPKVS